ncbi:MAG: SCP2 sterol-binding domain-containing protein [Candidatus Thorarchaeota archaeon]|nr:SCP2 sterol-binding domain-containing protein [Candidatus Thorarchaeota archaeon]
MVTEEELLTAIHEMIRRTEDPKMEKRFQGYNKSLMMTFSDLNIDISVIFRDGKGVVEKGAPASPDMTIKTDSKTIIDILGGNLSAMRAFMSGRIKADGPAKDLMKLQHLLKA